MIESPHSVEGSAVDGQSYGARWTPGIPAARTGRSKSTVSTGVVMGQHWALTGTGTTGTFVLDACSGFGSARSRRASPRDDERSGRDRLTSHRVARPDLGWETPGPAEHPITAVFGFTRRGNAPASPQPTDRDAVDCDPCMTLTEPADRVILGEASAWTRLGPGSRGPRWQIPPRRAECPNREGATPIHWELVHSLRPVPVAGSSPVT